MLLIPAFFKVKKRRCKCPSLKKGYLIRISLYVHTMEYYIAIKKN